MVNPQINAPLYLGCSVEKVTDSRSFDTEYQNTYSMPKLCLVSVGVNVDHDIGAAFAWISSDPTEPSDWIRIGMEHCNWYGTAAHLYGTITFIVPPGWYYKVTSFLSIILHGWIEESLYATTEEGG